MAPVGLQHSQVKGRVQVSATASTVGCFFVFCGIIMVGRMDTTDGMTVHDSWAFVDTLTNGRRYGSALRDLHTIRNDYLKNIRAMSVDVKCACTSHHKARPSTFPHAFQSATPQPHKTNNHNALLPP